MQCVNSGKYTESNDGWSLPIIRNMGHIFLAWAPINEVLFTRTQLHRMHQHFMHPSVAKLYGLLQCATPEQLTTDNRELLNDIVAKFHVCHIHSTKPVTFQVRFPDSVLFNQELRLDLVYLDGSPVLHVVDCGTNFNAARFLHGEDAETVWNTFVEAWATMYVGFPESISTHQGSAFLSDRWRQGRSVPPHPFRSAIQVRSLATL